jgi:hypothetical protein
MFQISKAAPHNFGEVSEDSAFKEATAMQKHAVLFLILRKLRWILSHVREVPEMILS